MLSFRPVISDQNYIWWREGVLYIHWTQRVGIKGMPVPKND
jgi:hypothetical protein